MGRNRQGESIRIQSRLEAVRAGLTKGVGRISRCSGWRSCHVIFDSGKYNTKINRINLLILKCSDSTLSRTIFLE